jgi:hypothetical protein
MSLNPDTFAALKRSHESYQQRDHEDGDQY